MLRLSRGTEPHEEHSREKSNKSFPGKPPASTGPTELQLALAELYHKVLEKKSVQLSPAMPS
jgi:hypothetical protein